MSPLVLKIIVGAVVALAVGYMLMVRSGDTAGPEARRLVDAGARLVDVRSPGEYADGHIEGAINIPVQDLDRRLAELEPKDQAIVVYCRSGQRSSAAASTLKAAGYGPVHNLGAMGRW